jgi:hypothetical protein
MSQHFNKKSDANYIGLGDVNVRCRCRGHGSPEIIDPCIRELVDCLNRHGVETLASCCGHGEAGEIILAASAITQHPNGGWILNLGAKPIVLPYEDETGEWVDEYPTGGRNLSKTCHEMNVAEQAEGI